MRKLFTVFHIEVQNSWKLKKDHESNDQIWTQHALKRMETFDSVYS